MEQQNHKKGNKKTSPAEPTTREKLRKARKILHRRIEKKYHKFRVAQIRRKKQHRLLRLKLSRKEYFEYRIYEIINGGWQRIVAFLAVFLIALLLVSSVVRGVAGLVTKISHRIHTVETEVETESEIETETETERIYPVKEITIGSTGCMLLHSPFITSYPDESGNYDFSSIYQFITPFYSAPDFMTCEFEGALGGDILDYSGYPMFISPDVIVENIKDSGVDLQFIATNHIYDGWSASFHRTMDVYEENNIRYSGARQSTEEKPYYLANINGVKVAFIDYVYETEGYSTSINGIPLDDADAELLNTFDYYNLELFYREMQENIDAMKQDGAQFIIAQMHWGTEYELQQNTYQEQMAQRLCDMGVNAIIGGHPHCEQPIDVLTSEDGENKMFVIYSEGNALSNQRTYLMDEMPTGHTEDGVMVTLTLRQDRHGEVNIVNVELLPTWVYRFADELGYSKYYILPLDDVANIEKTTGISDIEEEAQASYDRTMGVLEEGLKKAQDVFYVEPEPETETETEMETETETEKKKRFFFF